jgi:hypothetical protein
MNIIYCVRDKEYSRMILSENRVRIDMIDFSLTQTLNEFSSFLKPNIYYSPEDFLFSLSDENDNLFQKEKIVELSQVEHFGWYYGQYHKSQIQLFSMASPQKFEFIKSSNPTLVISSFDRYRESYRPIQATNILNGAIGLSYYSFREDFDQFFQKIKIDKNQWIIEKSTVDKKEYAILALLFLYHNARTNELNKTVFTGDSLRSIRMLSTFLELAMNYFVENDYTMDGFLNKMSGQLDLDNDLKIYAKNLKILCEKYVKKGLPYNPDDPFTRFSKQFIDLAKTETNKLNKFKSEEGLSIISVSLVGMVHLGDRIDEIISFDSFIPAIIELTMKHVIKIEATNDQIFISFDNREVEKNRNNKFNYVRQYIQELKDVKKLIDATDELSIRKKTYKKNYGLHTDLNKIKNDNTSLEKEIEELKKDLEGKQNKLLAIKDRIASIDKESQSKRKILDDKKHKLSDLNKQIASIDKESQSKRKILDDKKHKLSDLNKQIASIDKESQ